MNTITKAQAATIGRIVGSARLPVCKPAAGPKTGSDSNDATAGNVDTAWRAVVAKALGKQVREPSGITTLAMDPARSRQSPFELKI